MPPLRGRNRYIGISNGSGSGWGNGGSGSAIIAGSSFLLGSLTSALKGASPNAVPPGYRTLPYNPATDPGGISQLLPYIPGTSPVPVWSLYGAVITPASGGLP